MGQPIVTTINRWDGGMTNDPRDPQANVARVVSNFNVFSNPHKLTPYRASESGDSAPSTSQKQNFDIALRTGSTYSLYALGVVSGTGRAEVLYKNLTTGGSNDLGDSGWATPANNQSSSGSTVFNLFRYYKKTGKIYGARAGQYIWSFSPTGAAWNDTELDLTAFTNISQGVVHSKDDILYVAYDNKIAKNDNGTWTAIALTLPTHFLITSICEFNDFLAIGCMNTAGVGTSRVFLWDRNTSLTTLDESFNWGEGSLMVLEELEGYLIGISQTSGLTTSFTGVPNSAVRFKDRILIRYLYRGGGELIKEFISENTVTQLPLYKQRIDNRLYFQMSLKLNGSIREGLFSIGQNQSGQFAVVHERTPNNATALTDGRMKGFYIVGDFVFQSYTDNGTFALSKTDDTAAYTTAVWETTKSNAKDSGAKKDLVGATITTEPLPSGGQAVVKYRKNEDTSYTTALTISTTNAISGDINALGGSLPKDYKELDWRLESVGGAEITSFAWKEEITGKKSYE